MDEEVKVADEINVKDGVKGARFNETNSGAPTYHGGAYRSITSISSDDQRRIRFAVKPKHSASETFFYIVIGNKTTFNEDGVYLFFKKTGEICYYDGTTTVLQTWEPRTLYVFDLYNINPTGDSFDIDINGVNQLWVRRL